MGGMTNLRWLSDRMIGAVTAGVAALGVGALLWLLAVASAAPADRQPELRIEAIKYGLGVVASGGAVAVLLLAVRRQHLSERAHELAMEAQRLAEQAHELARQAQSHVETDAAERRVTDLFTKAVEQLGSPAAAVRLGGLYALERVAQNNPEQRQTVVNVICAYLRMSSIEVDPETTGMKADEEFQVRLTAQRILLAHTSRPADVRPEYAETLPPEPGQSFWPGMDIDLTGATLFDWRVDRWHPGDAIFAGATFVGWVGFAYATFTGRARFNDAFFKDDALFDRATFTRDAWFSGARFGGEAWFSDAIFARQALFDGARFEGSVRFTDARFTAEPDLSGAGVRSATVESVRDDAFPRGWDVVADPDDPMTGRLVHPLR
jgi:Pentapeptide repeats (9 copies)